MKSIAVVILCCMATGMVQAQPRPASAPSVAQIAATGVGELRLPPARATLLMVVETAGNDASDVAQDSARRVTRVRRALEKLGIAAEAIQNAGYSLRDEPHRVEQKERKPWIVARHSLSIRVADVNRVGAVIDTALAAGANEVANIAFQPADEAEAKKKALAAAVEQARAHAEAMAAAAGGRLGELIEITYAEGEVRPLAMARASAETDVSRSEIIITERVQARWRFVEKARK